MAFKVIKFNVGQGSFVSKSNQGENHKIFQASIFIKSFYCLK